MKSDENAFITAHKPIEDGFPFEVETDSLADSMGLRLPNRSLFLLQGGGRGWEILDFATFGSRHGPQRRESLGDHHRTHNTRLDRTNGKHRLRHDRLLARGPGHGPQSVRNRRRISF